MSILSSSVVLATTTATSSSITPPIVKIISQETVKPSSPTPHHLRIHKLSLLDHLAPAPLYISFELFYDQINLGRNRSDDLHRHLKKTLAETLTDFYILSGRVKHSHEGCLFVDCTDDGVEYLEARVNAQLHETIKDPDVYLLNQLLPLDPCQLVVKNTRSGSSSGSSSPPILVVQVNTFDCGGLAVGVSMSHEVSDNIGLVLFMQSWAAKAHGGSDTIPVDPPLIGFESLFPLRDIPEAFIMFFRGDIVAKRFVFDSSKISSLREKMMIHMNDGSYLTRVEVLTTFMWRRFMNIRQAKIRSGQTGSLQLCVAQAVNVRKMINLPRNSFGNLYFSSLLPLFSIDGSDKHYECFMSRLRNTMSNINGDYVRRELQLGEDGEYLKFGAKVGKGICRGELETLLHFTSWCRMGYYEVDFGWGKPVWMCPGTVPFKDVVVFTDSKSGDGIEVWVNMIQEDIDSLERDQEFLAFVS